MSKDKYKHAMEVIENWEMVEIYCNATKRWQSPPWPVVDQYEIGILNDPTRCRIKETPTKLPFGPEDIRPGMVFRRGHWTPGVWVQVAEVCKDGVNLGTGDRKWSWHHLQSCNWLYSIDGITWHPCEKPSPPPPKREPRRVFVNFDSQGNPGNAKNTYQDAIGTAHTSWCSESAVEFVEVIK